MSTSIKKRLAQLEARSEKKAIGILWPERSKSVMVDGAKMTLRQFRKVYPSGTLIRVIREDKKQVNKEIM